MVITVGINGFGRIGRIVSRACLQNSGIQLTAINDPAISVDYVTYLMKFDSTHGTLDAAVTHNDKEIVIDGHHVKVFHEKYPPQVPWHSAGVQYVVEASGMFTSYEKASGHLISIGVKRVIITAPSIDVPMLILGVNDKNICPDRRIISCASSTLYCLAPIIKVLDDNFGIEDGFMTSIHAMTPSLKPLDGLCLRGRHWRDHRSIHQNIIPAPTGACKALGKILPNVKNKLSGIAFRVPIVNVSVLDLTVRLQNDTSLPDIVEAVHKASKSTLRNIIKVSREEAVSSDFMADSHSCILDEDSSIQLKANFYKIICWYENEHSYACRVLDSIIFSENQFFLKIPINITLRPAMSTKLLQTEIPVVCNCNPGVSSEGISNVSQDTGLETRSSTISIPNRQKNSLAISFLNTTKFTKTDELIKVWNYRSEMRSNLKPSRCSLVESRAGLEQSSLKMIESNTQERLENVKREFNKMVNMTEDLLKKAQNNQGVGPMSNAETTVRPVTNLREKTETSKKDIKSCTKIINNIERVDTKCSGDMIQRQKGTCNDNNDEKTSLESFHSAKTVLKVDNSKIRDNSTVVEDAIKKLYEGSRDKEDLLKLKIKTYNEDAIKPNNSKSKQTTETVDLLDNRLPQNKEFRCDWNCHHLITTKKIGKIEDMETKVTRGRTVTDLTSSNNNNEVSKKSCDHPKTIRFVEQIEVKPALVNTNEFELKNVKSKMQIIDEELRKRNIVLVPNDLTTDNASGSPEDRDGSIPNINDKLEDDVVQLSDHVLGRYSPEDIFKSVSSVPTLTTASNISEERQDIYDKLDSTSGSNTSNSFEVKEKRSQVIQLTDISNSFEDLSRLNNICRIIEISDELSDKLFSALDDVDETDIKNKKWSFKNLCARLKLDEFCNKVFGGTAV